MPNNAHDRYVTWAMQVPEGVAVPALEQWGMPVWFPDPQTFFPKNVQWTYAIRNPADGFAFTLNYAQMIPAPAGVWFIYTDGSGYGMVADEYFTGDRPDLSGGTQYPPEEVPVVDPGPPPWEEPSWPPVEPEPEPQAPAEEPPAEEPQPEPEPTPEEPQTPEETP